MFFFGIFIAIFFFCLLAGAGDGVGRRASFISLKINNILNINDALDKLDKDIFVRLRYILRSLFVFDVIDFEFVFL